MRRGDIIFSQPILRKMLGALDKSHIEDVSEFMASHIIKEIKIQEGDVSYFSLIEHILKWNKANHLSLNKIKKKPNGNNIDRKNLNESDVFVSRHNLGKIWSEMECKTYKRVFEMIGKTVISSEYDEDTFSFEVIGTREIIN